MFSIRSLFHSVILSLIIFSLFLTYVPPVYACMPALPDSWFTTTLSFDTTNLPPGVMLIPSEESANSYALQNTTSEPFYIVKEYHDGLQEFPGSEIPQNLQPHFKLFDNKSYYYVEGGYKLNEDGEVYGAEKQVTITDDLITIDGEIKKIHETNRPQSVEIPPPQNLTLLGFYNGSIVKINGSVIYSLNQNYDPNQGSSDGCARFNQMYNNLNHPLILAMQGLFLVTIGVVGVFAFVYVVHKVFGIFKKK